jgi:hypothetical protein
MEKPRFIKADNNNYINESSILWVKKIREMFFLCNVASSIGCTMANSVLVTKSKNPESYDYVCKMLNITSNTKDDVETNEKVYN